MKTEQGAADKAHVYDGTVCWCGEQEHVAADKAQRKTCPHCHKGAIFPDTHYCAVCNKLVHYDQIPAADKAQEWTADRLYRAVKCCGYDGAANEINVSINAEREEIKQLREQLAAAQAAIADASDLIEHADTANLSSQLRDKLTDIIAVGTAALDAAKVKEGKV